MKKVKMITQETLKNANCQIILNDIRRHGEISRIDLAEHTKLSPTTVSSIVSELISEKLVTELRIGESSGGRRPVMLGINPEARYAVTMILDQKSITFTIVNLSCQAFEKGHLTYDIHNAETMREALKNGLDRIMEKYSPCREKICGIGVSVPGVVDRRKGKILYSSKLHLENYDFLSEIEEKTGIRGYIFKDTDALILGEYNFGIGSTYKNIVYINIENGVGMSYIYSGKLFEPGYGGGFELGHITIDANGELCRCGNRGCLGTVVSEIPVIRRLGELMNKGFETGIRITPDISLEDIVEYSNRGDKAGRYVLEEQARFLGTATASVVNLFNPQLIVIGGPFTKCTWGFMDILKDTVRDRALHTYSKNVNIQFSKLGNDSALYGMANEILEREIFKPLELFNER